MQIETLRANLRRLLKTRKTNAHRLGLDAKVGPTYIHDLLKGKTREPGAEKLQRIAGALGVTVDELYATTPVVPLPAPQVEGAPIARDAVNAAAGILYQALFDANIQTDAQTFGELAVTLAAEARRNSAGALDLADMRRMIRVAIASRKPTR